MASTATPLKPLNLNAFYADGGVQFEAYSDRLLVLEDDFRSGYECQTCHGSGTAPCDNCSGTGEARGKRCSQCGGSKTAKCESCGGKGGVLIVPDISQNRPTTGRVVSVGNKVTDFSLGDTVMFSSFAGHHVDTVLNGRPAVIRIFHEKEVLCRVHGHLTLTNFKGKSEFALSGKTE